MKNEILSDLNTEQKEAVLYTDGPLLIVAGAGTGKTTVITRKVAYLIHKKNIQPEDILAVTFTERAASEMEERVESLLPYGFVDLWVSTFHSFCERILKEYGLDIGISNDFKVLDTTACWLLVRQNFNRFNLKYYRPLGSPTRFIYALINHFSRCKDEGIFPEDYLKYADDLKFNFEDYKKKNNEMEDELERIKEIAQAYHEYQKLLLENNSLDFGDLINYCLKLFQTRPLILKKYQEKFKYILVDEFQDTNWAQYELVKLLASPKNNLTVCADDDQSIFQFRGASFNNVLQFKKDFPKSKEVVLVKNYRSCQEILDLSYKFIQLNNPNRLEYQLNQVQQLKENAQKKGVDLNLFKKIDKKLLSQVEEKAIIELLHFNTHHEEIDGVINKIINLLKEDKDSTFNDFAILTRTNETANSFSRAMEKFNLPYHFVASQGLYSKPVILDIISYFKLLDNYHEDSAMYRILNLPFLNVDYNDIVEITNYSYKKSQSTFETLQQLSLVPNISQNTIQKINFLLSLIKKHTIYAKEKNVSELFLDFLQSSGYLKYLTKKDTPKNRESLDLINQFYDKIKEFEESQIEARLKNFMEMLNLELEAGEEGSLKFDPEIGPDMIKIMTIHSAKGLEFKYVFLPSLVDKRFPTISKRDPIEIPEPLIKEVIPSGDIHLQEERRLFYVALTRAKKGLFLSFADNYGGARNKKPSRFLFELGILHNEIKGSSAKDLKDKILTDTILLKNSEELNKNKVLISKLPSHISFTQIAAFNKCPLQYKFAHILKIQVKGNASFSYGKTMHNSLFDFVRLWLKKQKEPQYIQKDFFNKSKKENIKSKTTPLTFDDLIEIYKRNWIDDWYESKQREQEYFNTGKDALKKFYNIFSQNPPEVAIVNGEFALEQKFNIKIGNHLLIGQIDRIDILEKGKKNKVEIIDYKTGQAPKNLMPEDKKQLLIYQIAAEEVLNFEPVRLTYYYLDSATTFSFIGSDKEKEGLKKEIEEVAQKIKRSNFAPTPGWHCKFCDFKNICEFKVGE